MNKQQYFNTISKEDFLKVDESIFKYEHEIQSAFVCYYRRFVKPKHKHMRMVVNPFSSIKMSQKMMMKAKQQGFQAKQPDIMIFTPYHFNLAFELKTIKANTNTKHCNEQKEYLESLFDCGFKAYMTKGLVVNIELLDSMLKCMPNIIHHQNIVAEYA